MFIKMSGLYGIESENAYFRKLGDGCFDFVNSKEFATDLSKEEANTVMAHKEWYCNQYKAESLVIEGENDMEFTQEDINTFKHNAPNYILIIDHKAGTVPEEFTPFHYEVLNKRDILGAMTEAEVKFWDSTVYMMEIAEKTDAVIDNRVVYKTVLSSRSKGNYHRTDAQHYEHPYTVTYDNWTSGTPKFKFGDRCEE